MAPAKFIRQREGFYWVLAEYESKSEPGKIYEVRTSMRDGKTYCTCRGWVCSLNKSKVTGGEALCKHIMLFRAAEPAEPIIIMDFESFAAVRRGIPLNIKSGKVGNEVKVRRA
jgi:predicted nucleic acid-binding Zn finger protein